MAEQPIPGMSAADYEFCQGYFDGRDPNAPEPSDNRSHCYRHSFAVGRAELANKPIPFAQALAAAEIAEAEDGARNISARESAHQ